MEGTLILNFDDLINKVFNEIKSELISFHVLMEEVSFWKMKLTYIISPSSPVRFYHFI